MPASFSAKAWCGTWHPQVLSKHPRYTSRSLHSGPGAACGPSILSCILLTRAFFAPILQIEKQRLREAKHITHSHTAMQRWTQDSNPGLADQNQSSVGGALCSGFPSSRSLLRPLLPWKGTPRLTPVEGDRCPGSWAWGASSLQRVSFLSCGVLLSVPLEPKLTNILVEMVEDWI